MILSLRTLWADPDPSPKYAQSHISEMNWDWVLPELGTGISEKAQSHIFKQPLQKEGLFQKNRSLDFNTA